MAYADYSRYTSIYGEGSISEIDFNRFSYDASRYMDYCTTGVDGVKKLKIAHPTDADDAEAVIRCACALIHDMSEMPQKNARHPSGGLYSARTAPSPGLSFRRYHPARNRSATRYHPGSLR